MKNENLPKARVFQDPFTRQFVQSSQEVEQGYYLFESGTRKFEMMIPGEAVMDGIGYSLEGNNDYESFLLYIYHPDGSLSHLQITFISINDARFIQDYLKITQSHAGEELAFNKTEMEDRDLYFAPAQPNILIDLQRIGYVAYLQNRAGTGGIQIYYDTFCDKGNAVSCEELKAEEKKKIQKLIFSIKFLSVLEGEEI
ncbi:hypothetical protein E2R51_16565 [Jeotgalibacillus sp. S-D1]|uniref:hypothetical protein n=1 Tax=Jeotgalibacillus sp. S-D1 TaxID=2552189 RepID=UPI0010595B35|nr:hypothetical protein [Jeotgalibacillus sp. S-D1]TDL30935.1 hypothetical protein E2R51_16565 [Jeotgalibacillus sp. S-D1]